MRTDILPLLQQGFHYILVYNFIRIESMEMKVDLSSDPEQITDLQVKSYMQCFLDINDFKKTENAKSLLELIRGYPDHSRVKLMLRTVVGMFNCNQPAARVCSLQFLKEALQTGSYFVLQTIEKNVLNKFSEIVQYRSGVKSLSRGSTYFVREIDKNMEDEEFMTLVRLSSTFFRMVQECLYVWGALYFPGSVFDRLRLKMGAKIDLAEFPKDFKFFSESKINNFKLKCKNLIKKLQERKTQSMINSKKSSINKEVDKKTEKQSEINSKKQQQLSKKRQKSEQVIDNPQANSKGQKLPPKKKKEKKKFVDSDQQKQKKQPQVISNNSSKLRKKNSFDDGQTIFNRNSPSQSSSELKRQQNSLNALTVTRPINLAKPITQRQQSEGGRYSINQSDNSLNPSNQLKDLQQNQKESSPRSQYSVTQAQPLRIGLKRQISQQLSNPTAINKYNKKDDSNIVIKSRENIDPKIERVNNKISIRLPIDQGKKRLKNEEEIQSKDKAIKSSKRKKIQSSAPRKFVSSQEQNHNEQKQIVMKETNNKAIKLMEKNQLYEEDNISNFQRNDKKNHQITHSPLSKRNQGAVNAQLIEAKSIKSSPQNLKGPIAQYVEKTTNVFMQPLKIQKASRPQKIKSNTNLQTVFESTDFKVIANKKEPKKQKVIQKFQTSKPKQKQQIKKIDIFAEASKNNQSKSIFDAVEMSSIKKVQEVSLTNNQATEKNQKQGSIFNEKNKVEQYQNQQNSTPHQTQRDGLNSNQQSQQKYQSSQYSNLQKADNNNNTVNGANKIQQKFTDEKKAKQAFNNTPIQSQNYNKIDTKVEKKKQPISHKNYRQNSIKTSRQFRHFKEVNLFIDPKSARVEPLLDSNEPIRIDSEQIESVLKEKIVQEFHKLKNQILIKQEQNFNNTIASLKSQIQQSKQERTSEKNQCSTQTKIRQKSKSKFEKKHVKLMEDDLTENINDQNNPKHKFSKTSVQTSHQNHHLTNIGNNQHYYQSYQLNGRQNEKKQEPIRQQMKPNTLLYALFRRKSINI